MSQNQTSKTSVPLFVLYYLSEAGQRSAALNGLQPRQLQLLEVGPDDSSYGELVSRAQVTPAGVLLVGVGGKVRYVDDRGYSLLDRTLPQDFRSACAHPGIARVQIDSNVTERRGNDYGHDGVPAPNLDEPLLTGLDAIQELARDADNVRAVLSEREQQRMVKAKEREERERRDREERLAKQRAAIPEQWAQILLLLKEATQLGIDVAGLEGYYTNEKAACEELLPLLLIDGRVTAGLVPEAGTKAADYLVPFQSLLKHEITKQKESIAAERALEEQRLWIAQYGSDRLRSCQELGLNCTKLYQDERLQHERPGWTWGADVYDFSEKEPMNPTMEALAMLRQVREIEPTAKLVWTGRGYAAGDVEYLGRTIWWDTHVDRDGNEDALSSLDERYFEPDYRGDDDETQDD